MVDLYLKAYKNIDHIKGQVFNVGGGMSNSSSLLELFTFLEKELDIKLKYHQLPVRKSDQRVFVADLKKTKKLLLWEPKISKEEGICKMIEWLKFN